MKDNSRARGDIILSIMCLTYTWELTDITAINFIVCDLA